MPLILIFRYFRLQGGETGKIVKGDEESYFSWEGGRGPLLPGKYVCIPVVNYQGYSAAVIGWGTDEGTVWLVAGPGEALAVA